MNIGTIEATLRINDQFSKVFGQFNTKVSQLGSSSSRVDAVSGSFNRLNRSILSLVSIAAVGVAVRAVTKAVSESQAKFAQLEAGVKSTGAAAGRSAEQLSELAKQLQRTSGVDDELIASGEAILLTFRRIGKDAFEPAMQAALDLSAKGFGDLISTSKMVGKALEDPVRGATALRRAGVQLSEGQRHVIEKLVETNKIAQAQKIILKELEIQVGGSAAAFRGTLAGSISALNNAWDDLLETIGQTGGSDGVFQTIIESMVRSLEYLTDNWFAFESAIYQTLADITKALTSFLSFWVDLWLKVAKALQGIQDLIPDFAGLGLASKTQKLADGMVSRFDKMGKSVKGFGNDLVEVFEEKAANAIESGIAPVKGLDESIQGLTNTTDDFNKEAEQLAERIKEVVAGIKEQIIQEKIRGAAIGLGEEAEKAAAKAIAIRVAVTGLGIAADSALGAEVRKLAGALFDLKDANDQATDAQERLAKQANLARQQWANAFTASVEDITRSREEYEEQIRIAIETGQDMADEFRRRASERLEIQREVDSFTRGPFQDALARAVEWHDDFIAKINDAEKRAVITAEEAADAILASETRLADERIQIIKEKNRQLVSDIGVAIDYLADQFGGLFNYLSDLIRSIQQAQGLGQSVAGIMGPSGFGMTAGTASSIGSAVTVLAIWKAIYDIGMDILKTNKAKKFGQAGGVVIEDGFTRRTTSPGVGQVSSEAIRAIQDVIKSFEEAFRLSIDDLSEIGIKLRNDGKKIRAYVAGVFIGEFNDTMEAIEAAFASALTNGLVNLGRVSDLFKEGLNNLPKTKDLDSVIDFLSKIKEIDELGLSQGALALREATFDFDKLWDALEKFKVVTPAVTKAFNDLVMSEARLWQDWLDSITGRQKSAAEVRADKVQELALFKVELTLRKALIAQRILLAQAEVVAIKTGRTLIGGTGGGGTSVGGANGGILGVAKAFVVAGSALTQVGSAVTQVSSAVLASSIALSDGALAMIAALEAEIAALVNLQDILDNLDIPSPEDIKVPREGGRGFGDEVGDFIRDRTRELGLAGLSDYLRSIAEINALYDEQLEKAGKDIKQREKLLDLKEQELALLAKEQKDSVVDRFRDFLGLVTPFDQVRETAEDLIKSINESPFGDARKAQMVSRVLEEIERQLDRLSQEMALGMFNDLASQLEAIGADELQIAELRRLALMVEHQLNIANHRANLEILRAEGRVSQQVLDTIDAAIRTLEGFNPAHGAATPPSQPGTMGVPSNEIVTFGGNRWKWDGTQWLNLGPVPGQEGGGGFKDWWKDQGGDTTNQLDEFNKKLQDAIKSLEAMEREALDPLTRDILDLQDRFAPIFETLGDNVEYASRVQSAYAAQLELIMRRHFGAINDLLEDAPTSDASPLRTIEKFALTQSRFFDAINSIVSGDFTKLSEVPTLYQDLIDLLGEVSPKGSERYRSQFDLFRSMLEQLSIIGGFDPSRIREMSSGMGFGNVLVPRFDIASQSLLNPVREAQISDNVVHIIGAHSDRQHLQLQETNSRLQSIEDETRRVRRSVGELAEQKVI